MHQGRSEYLGRARKRKLEGERRWAHGDSASPPAIPYQVPIGLNTALTLFKGRHPESTEINVTMSNQEASSDAKASRSGPARFVQREPSQVIATRARWQRLAELCG